MSEEKNSQTIKFQRVDSDFIRSICDLDGIVAKAAKEIDNIVIEQKKYSIKPNKNTIVLNSPSTLCVITNNFNEVIVQKLKDYFLKERSTELTIKTDCYDAFLHYEILLKAL